MKKIALLLCLILCFGVLVSCKASENDKKDDETIKDDGNQVEAETYEVNIRKSFYLSEDVFVANVLNYEESERSVNVKVRIQEVFKGNCDIGQIMDLKLEGRQDTQFSEIIKEGESEFDCLFMLGHDSWAEHNLNENEKQRRRSIANHTVRIFKVSDDGLIRLNYGSKMVWLNSYDVRKIPESIEDMVQQVFMYKPLVIYLKQRLGTNSIGVLGKAENVFIGEIQPIDRALFEEIRGFLNPNITGFKIDDKYKLNEFKDNLVKHFNLQEVSSNIWELERDKFISKFNNKNLVP